MSSMWRNLLGLFRKDSLYAQAIEECHQATDHLGLLLNVSLSHLGRLPPAPPHVDLPAIDKALIQFNDETRKKVTTHITASGPGHLISGLVLLTTVIDLEKLTENVRQIRGVASAHRNRLGFADAEEDVADIEKRTLTLFRNMRDALKGDDVELSRDVMARYKGGLSASCDSVAGRLLAGDIPDISHADSAAASLYIINIKRVGIHARNLITNIASPFQRLGTQEATQYR